MTYPESILIEKFPNTWIEYQKMYEHAKNGCYYEEKIYSNDFITGNFISLYPDGKLTYLWNGIEHEWNVKYKFNN